MDINKYSGLISTICVFAFFHTVLGSELVPVFMWGSPNSYIVPALTQVNNATFTEILLDEKSNPQIIVFAEESLSPEDFRDQQKENLEEISLLSANKELTYLPLVDNPIGTIKDFFPKDIANISITNISSAKDIPSHPRIVIVSLDDAKYDEDRSEMLRRHNDTVSELCKELVKDRSKILVLFTGIRPSWIMPDQIINHRQSRSVTDKALAKYDDDNRVFLNNSEFAIFVNNSVEIITINDKNEEEVEYYELIKLNVGGTTDNITNGTELRADDETKEENTYTITANDSKSFKFTLTKESGYWRLETIETETGFKFIAKNVYAPAGFSYHCSNAMMENYDKTLNVKTILRFPNLQIQYNGSTVNGFGDAYDCVGFTTAPIWSGLFITFILALIMTLGLTMMMDIKTMDRFDDPKGKTIIINAAE